MAGTSIPAPAPSATTTSSSPAIATTTTAPTAPSTQENSRDERRLTKLKQAIARHARPSERAQRDARAIQIPQFAVLTPNARPAVVLLSDGALSSVHALLQAYTGAAAQVVDVFTPGAKFEHLLFRLQCGLFDALRAFSASTHASGAHTLFILNLGVQNLGGDMLRPRNALAPRDVDRFMALLRALAGLAPGVRVLVTARTPRHGVLGAFGEEAAGQLREAVALVRRRLAKERQECSVFFAGPFRQRATEAPPEMPWAPKDFPRAVRLWCLQLHEAAEVLLRPEVDEARLQSINVQAPTCAEEDDGDARGEASEKTCPYAPMRPAQDVYSRIQYDQDGYAPEHFTIGYEDRHSGILEIPFTEWRREVSHEDFVPMHRVRYFKHAQQGILWDRKERVDRIFGGS